MDQENVSATLTVAVPAAKVFAVLADPTAHSAQIQWPPHGLGGVAGYDAAETTDENPRRVAAVARLTLGLSPQRAVSGGFRLAGSL
jgi:hypothetical protein